jgi:integrase/recombinase XerC
MVLYDNETENKLGYLYAQNEKKDIPPCGQMHIMDAFCEMTSDSWFQPSTINSYKRDTIHLIRFLEKNGVEPTLGAVSSRLAHDWITTQEAEGYSASTIRKRAIALITLYRFSMKWDLVKSNPFKQIRLPYVEDQTRPHLLSVGELIHIMRGVKSLKKEGGDMEPVVRMMLFSGLKTQQLVNLTVEDVGAEEGVIRYKKRHRYEVKPIPPLLCKQIQDTIVRKGLKEEEPLLRGLSGLPIRPNQLHRIIQKLSDQIGWTEHRLTVHSMRVSMAFQLYLKGLDPYLTSYFLGLKPPENSLPFISELIKIKQEDLIHTLTQVENEIEEGTKGIKKTSSKVVHFKKRTLP